MQLTTTLNRLQKLRMWRTPQHNMLLSHIGANYPQHEPINLLTILESNGIRDTLLILGAIEQNCENLLLLMAADFAEDVLPIWLQYYPDDIRPQLAIQAERNYANGLIPRQQLVDAWNAVHIAVDGMRDTTLLSQTAYSAIFCAGLAAYGCDMDDACMTALDASGWHTHAHAAVAGGPTWSVKHYNESTAARARQKEIFLRYFAAE